MASTTTTITLNNKAYNLLLSLKGPGQTFSDVVIEYVRPPAKTGAELLKRIEEVEGMPLIDDQLIRKLRTGRGRSSNRGRRHVS